MEMDNSEYEPITVRAINANGQEEDVTLENFGNYSDYNFMSADFTRASENHLLDGCDFSGAKLSDVKWPQWWRDVYSGNVLLSEKQMRDLNNRNRIPVDYFNRMGYNNEDYYDNLNAFIDDNSEEEEEQSGGKRKTTRKLRKYTRKVKKTNKRRKSNKRRKTKRRYRK